MVEITVKYSSNTATPTSLANGELAFSANGSKMFIGQEGSVISVGGREFPGTLTANQALVADANSHLDHVKTTGITITTSGGTNTKYVGVSSNVAELSNTTTLVSSKAVENYLTDQLAGDLTLGANVTVTGSLIDGSGRELKVLYSNGNTAWGNE